LLKKATIDIAPAGWHKLSQATIQQQQLAGLHGCSLLPCPTASHSLLPGPPLHRCQAHHVMHHYTASSCWEMPPSGNCCGEICCYHCPASAHHYTTVSRMLVQSRPGYTTDTTAENAHESMHFVWAPQCHCTCPAEGGGGGGGGRALQHWKMNQPVMRKNSGCK